MKKPLALPYKNYRSCGTKGIDMNNTRLSFGQVVCAKFSRDDGMGEKSRPCIVLEDDSRFFRVLAGSSQMAPLGSPVSGEFLVYQKGEVAEKQLTLPTRFSWKAEAKKPSNVPGCCLGKHQIASWVMRFAQRSQLIESRKRYGESPSFL